MCYKKAGHNDALSWSVLETDKGWSLPTAAFVSEPLTACGWGFLIARFIYQTVDNIHSIVDTCKCRAQRTEMSAAIAQHLNVTESAILEVQEWARVLWVRVKGLGARFVSKKVAKKMEIIETNAVVQVCQDNGEHTLIRQMPHATILSDGRVQFKTPKGLGFLVCKEACEALGLDASKGVFDASMSEVHYRLNQPQHGKVVQAYVSESGEFALNPEWVAYNNTMNEGGEGYNPHPKHVTVKKSQTRYL